ncbi:tRNA (N6-isopentenyl adenosine(37)-C2)-methylthiotransferase MiaB [Treponema endosymbiont of Eucomonympha sp.]|uniref:tRNA (N6-isopentenyl adenosine(37)-C2)-methylthiotransferase MiaB n=1 Tax=Treponema endosymbiont of Eucomonympha sp. TaxID=1580831 RepID=UPI000A8BB841|nr:tRNA (N6-isopentenyl adenosine(37)-C2)-methylthiotransferase MiaB [Treponema endosymbiont of Eucomonympha sp.]
MRYFFETYGCQMNKAESAAVEQLLLGRGWSAAATAEEADMAVINTCSVRATAESRISGRLGWYAGLKAVRLGAPEAKSAAYPAAARGRPLALAVMGCMAERLLGSFKARFPVVDYVVGTFQKQRFAGIAEAVEQRRSLRDAPTADAPAEEYRFPALSLAPGASSAFVPVMHGCDNFCAYCVVPFVRGREVSRSPEHLLAEIDALSARSVREITLLGQNVNSYRWQGTDFPRLVRLVADRLRETASPVEWVRFLSSHPKDLSPALIQTMRDEPLLCRHVHLPVQHGSTRILRAMNRRYTRGDYLEKARLVRESLPGASLSTDMLVGFPGETDADFAEALSLLREVRFESAFMYYYNPREGTAAAAMPGQIPLAVRKERLQAIIDLQLAVTREEMAKRIGQEAKVLAQSVSRGKPSASPHDLRQALPHESPLVSAYGVSNGICAHERNKHESHQVSAHEAHRSPAGLRGATNRLHADDDQKPAAELLGKTERDERVVFAAPKSMLGRFVTVRLSELTGNTFRGIVR